ncbi:porphobilinogen synthase [Lacrimispora sphenoides]|uniref:Delta-aminolevulinic acid dehydratase n=1 Tax=Lacrimispora sphenoides JCM 1415 TaxID=1297793 RepID=A0ABY1C569_9FIRM|nr:porphobilinogen synthase [Lacrimispora sphenoides]SET68260.1 porphobilinogen synthase [[Clostridium] sphenoides JCM 1415]SUY50463.1 porphobilinogen synthase [Lacrimispora sphenoides]
MDLLYRPRRLRTSDTLRKMVRETRVSKESLIYPLFVVDGKEIVEEIPSMEGQYRYSVDRLRQIMDRLVNAGVEKVLLFGIPAHKDTCGSQAYDEEGVVQRAIRFIIEHYPMVYIVTDVCMCEYTSHGHCGILDGESVDNDKTLEYLNMIALSHVKAGAHMVAPSDMMDGRIGSMRQALDEAGFVNVPIMAYSAKYSSAFYGPFREAAGSAPSFGDRKSYQMDYHNRKEALKEVELDVAEGADIVMVKPALSYLDIIREVADRHDLPVAAYSVSGEYAMIKAASKAGFIEEEKIVCESAVSIYRAGADILITYYAIELARFMDEGKIG